MRDKRRSNRAIATVAAVIVASYFLVSMAFVLPAGGLKTVLRPLANISAPFFAQGWNIFAPNIAKSNVTLQVQAQLIDAAGDRFDTGWVDVTQIELAAVPDSALPSRISKNSINLLNRYLSRYNRLTPAQQEIARADFVISARTHVAAKPIEDLQKEMMLEATNVAEVRDFLKHDNVLKEFATIFATAYFKDESVAQVRWKIVQQPVNDFEVRYSAQNQYPSSETVFGWRIDKTAISDNEIETFREVIARHAGADR